MGVWSTNYLFGNMLIKSLGGYLLGVLWLALVVLGLHPGQLRRLVALVSSGNATGRRTCGSNRSLTTRSTRARAVPASQSDRVTFRQYAQLATNPIMLAMGASYFCIKFLRYALDSWLPAFLNIQGLNVARASYYSQVFDFAGVGGVLPGRLGARPLVQGQLGGGGRRAWRSA